MSTALSAMSFMSQFDEYIMSALILRAVSVTMESLDVDDIMLDSGDKIGAVSVKYTVSSFVKCMASCTVVIIGAVSVKSMKS